MHERQPTTRCAGGTWDQDEQLRFAVEFWKLAYGRFQQSCPYSAINEHSIMLTMVMGYRKGDYSRAALAVLEIHPNQEESNMPNENAGSGHGSNVGPGSDSPGNDGGMQGSMPADGTPTTSRDDHGSGQMNGPNSDHRE